MSTRFPFGESSLPPVREPTDEIRAANLDSLHKTGKFSDLQLLCGGHEFAVHKAIICPQSRVFSTACEGGFEELRTNVMTIEEFDVDTVQRKLDFLYAGRIWAPGIFGPRYFGSYNSGDANAVVTTKDILGWHLRANAIGDYYDIEPLCAPSRSKLGIEVSRNWSAVDFMQLLTEACTTRKTGDPEFYRLLGPTMGDHMEDLAGLHGLDDLELPGAMLTSMVASSLMRVRSLRGVITQQGWTIRSLQETKSAAESQRSMTHNDQRILFLSR
ncbi:hypothetical protein DHEL01_v204021 [Diaporthe helianthi]|uniref:BTB domain-containing protein n=1 Tax=Diaporthe helianthi TaxID=158607 RepID=A0A2P5I527_DIAHE|nr:hypothetical protein DHEL01_v204021 [Diaporthe helianthi]